MNEPKPQICIIHGGTVFESDDAYRQSLQTMTLNYERLLYAPSWKSWIAEQLPGYDVLLPSLPDKVNAKYDEWVLYFSKIVPFLRPDAVLVGHSLGGVFLAKYFTDHPPATPYRKIILIAAPYDDETDESMAGFKLSDASNLAAAATDIHIFHSTDDPVVAFTEHGKYLRDLPDAVMHVFDDKQHFNMAEFPELLALL